MLEQATEALSGAYETLEAARHERNLATKALSAARREVPDPPKSPKDIADILAYAEAALHYNQCVVRCNTAGDELHAAVSLYNEAVDTWNAAVKAEVDGAKSMIEEE
jgi:hypothetical protein